MYRVIMDNVKPSKHAYIAKKVEHGSFSIRVCLGMCPLTHRFGG